MEGYVQMQQRTGSQYKEQVVCGYCIWAVGLMSEDTTGCDYLLATSTLLIFFPLLIFFGRVVSPADSPYGC